MIGIATTLKDAKAVALWEGVLRRMAVHFTPEYGKSRTRELLEEAAALAFPPLGDDAWDFQSGIEIDDQLEPLIRRLHRGRARDQDATQRGALSQSGHEEPLRVAGIRSHFANDPDTLAVFESMLRRGAGGEVNEPVLGARERNEAVARLWAFMGEPSRAMEEPVSGVGGVNGDSETQLLREVVDIVRKEDLKRVRTLTQPEMHRELEESGWQGMEIRTIVAHVRAEEVDVAALREDGTESSRPVPPVVPLEEERPVGTNKPARWGMGALAVMVAIAMGVWALRSGSLDSPTRVARHNASNADMAAAVDLRTKAAEDCAAARWKTCVEELDQAKQADPDGDESDEVVKERQTAKAGMANPARAGNGSTN
jgi:hypothetical protein